MCARRDPQAISGVLDGFTLVLMWSFAGYSRPMNEAGFFIFGETYSRGILEALLRVYWQNVMVPTEPASHAPYKPSQMPSGLQVRPEDRNHGRSNRKERHTVGLALLAGSGIGTSRGGVPMFLSRVRPMLTRTVLGVVS